MAFIGKDGALVVGIKFGGRPAETGTFAYADPEYGVWYWDTVHQDIVSSCGLRQRKQTRADRLGRNGGR